MSGLSVLKAGNEHIPMDVDRVAVIIIEKLAARNRVEALGLVDRIHQDRKNYTSDAIIITGQGDWPEMKIMVEFEDSMGKISGRISVAGKYMIYENMISLSNLPSTLTNSYAECIESSEPLKVSDVLKTDIFAERDFDKIEKTASQTYLVFAKDDHVDIEWEDLLPSIENLTSLK